MAASKDSTTNSRDTDTPDSFFPEDAQEKNFASARESAQKNHEKDLETRSVGYTDEDRVQSTESVEVINPAEPPLGDAQETDTNTKTTSKKSK